jgi:hypothetical protein
MNGSDNKQLDPLGFMSPRLREILDRLANHDRRTPMQELAALIEGRAYGHMPWIEGPDIKPVISVTNLPEAVGIEARLEPQIPPGGPGKEHTAPTPSTESFATTRFP